MHGAIRNPLWWQACRLQIRHSGSDCGRHGRLCRRIASPEICSLDQFLQFGFELRNVLQRTFQCDQIARVSRSL